MTPTTKRLLVGSGAVVAFGLLSVFALVAFVFFIQPRRVIAKYDRLVDK